MLKLTFLSILFAPLICLAQWIPSIEYQSSQSSEELFLSEATLRLSHPTENLSYGPLYRQITHQLGAQSSPGDQFGVFSELEFDNSLLLDIEMGAHRLQTFSLEPTSFGYLNSQMTKAFSNTFELRLRIINDLGYYHLGAAGPAIRDLRLLQATLGLKKVFLKRWKALFEIKHDSISDSNQRSATSNAILYGFKTKWPHFWLGLGLDSMWAKEAVAEYWSPTLYYAYGPRLDSAFSFTKNFSIGFALNLNQIEEKDEPSGQGLSNKTRLIWKSDSGNISSLDINYVTGQRGGENWSNTSWGLNFGQSF